MDENRFLLLHPIFTSREYSFAREVSTSSASRTLHNLAKKGTIQSITRGLWAQPHHPNFSLYGLVPYILGNELGYVSFLSSLHRHGVISQIPQIIQVASTGHGRKLQTSLGTFELFQLKPEMMMTGVKWFEGKVNYRLASAEKALLDCLYLSTRKGNRFSSFPEMDLSKIKMSTFNKILNEQIKSKKIKNAVAKKFNELYPSQKLKR
jgi:predicted transcriptional regulator of viral defense system